MTAKYSSIFTLHVYLPTLYTVDTSVFINNFYCKLYSLLNLRVGEGGVVLTTSWIRMNYL